MLEGCRSRGIIRYAKLTGHCEVWLLHQEARTPSLTELGSIEYWLCANAMEIRALEAKAVVVNVFIV